MGIVVLSNDANVPFPRRLFSAIAEREVAKGQHVTHWENIINSFEGGGCFLDIRELPDDELSAFKIGIKNTLQCIDTLEFFEGFRVADIQKSLQKISNHTNN